MLWPVSPPRHNEHGQAGTEPSRSETGSSNSTSYIPHEPLTARFVAHWLMGRGLVRRELLEKVGYFVPEKGAAAFWDLTLRMMAVRPRLLDIPLVIHYPHPNDEG